MNSKLQEKFHKDSVFEFVSHADECKYEAIDFFHKEGKGNSKAEMALENMYGKKYEDYKKKTIIGIPFI